MRRCELRYGVDGNALQFVRSETHIALAPKPGNESHLGARLAARHGGSNVSRVGQFQMIDVAGDEANPDELLDEHRTMASVAVGSHVFNVEGGDDTPWLPSGALFIEFKPTTSKAKQLELIDKYALAMQDVRGPNSFVLSVTSQSRNPLKVAKDLQMEEEDYVDVSEPEFLVQRQLFDGPLPSDEYLSSQWHLENTGRHLGTDIFFVPGADARVVDAWRYLGNLGSSSISIAVIDDGFDLQHPDFNVPGKIVAPRDFSDNDYSPLPTNPGPFQSHDLGDWHGTACAGVAVGAAGGGKIVGACPNARFMPIRMGQYLSDYDIENWFGYASQLGADVVSCSWGAAGRRFPLSHRAFGAIRRCAQGGRGGKGAVIVFAAGNSNADIGASATHNGFAMHPDVIAVAASTSRDQRSHYSNYGQGISVCAPSNGSGGAGIVTADVMGDYSSRGQLRFRGYQPGSYNANFGGTSSACPLVAGVCALVLSKNPNATSAAVKRIIQQTARKIGQPSTYLNGWSPFFGFGCVNAADAVRQI